MKKPTTLEEYEALKVKARKSLSDMRSLKDVSEYDLQAWQLISDLNIKIDVHQLGTFPYFSDEKESRDVYQITLTRTFEKNGHTGETRTGVYSFRFGDSIANMEARQGIAKPYRGETVYKHEKRQQKIKLQWCKPGAYDVLACLTSYDPGTFGEFCSSYGYDEDSRKAFNTYLAVQREWEGVQRIFTTEEDLEALQEIN